MILYIQENGPNFLAEDDEINDWAIDPICGFSALSGQDNHL